MSPLAWNMKIDQAEKFIKQGPDFLTIDLILLFAKR